MLGAIEILKQDLKLFSDNWKKMMPFLWLLILPTFVLVAIGILFSYLTALFPTTMLVNGLIILAIFVAAMLFSFWVNISLTKYLYDVYQNQPTKNWKEYLSLSSPLILPIILVSLLTTLIVFGGLILLIIPGLIFALWYIFATYVMMLEDKKKITECLSESKRLVVGRWWAIFWRFFLPGAILGLGFMILSGLLTWLEAWLLNSFPMAQTAIFMIVSTVINIIVTPLSVGLVIVIYTEARNTRPEAQALPTV